MLLLILITLANAEEGSFILNMVEGDIGERPVRYASWCSPPDVIVCEGSLIDIETVTDAYQFLSQDISSIKYGKCECKINRNQIQFGVECFDNDSSLGKTLFNFDKVDECMIGSVVQIYKPETIVIVHEAGHSAGWMHSSVIGHLMFPMYRYAGWNTYGMGIQAETNFE